MKYAVNFASVLLVVTKVYQIKSVLQSDAVAIYHFCFYIASCDKVYQIKKCSTK